MKVLVGGHYLLKSYYEKTFTQKYIIFWAPFVFNKMYKCKSNALVYLSSLPLHTEDYVIDISYNSYRTDFLNFFNKKKDNSRSVLNSSLYLISLLQNDVCYAVKVWACKGLRPSPCTLIRKRSKLIQPLFQLKQK